MSDTTETLVEPNTRRVVRYHRDQVGNDLTAHLAWCSAHHQPVWVYGDESYSCPYDLAVGWSPDQHVIEPGPWETAPVEGDAP